MRLSRCCVWFIGALAILSQGLNLSAQIVQDTVQLAVVSITAERAKLFEEGVRVTTIDKQKLELYGQNDLGRILSLHSPVFVKTYGSGSLATLSFRGSGAEHTKIVWNGIPINSPVLGMTDMALLPAFFVDEVNVHHGGSSSLYGNSAIGGIVRMESDAGNDKGNTFFGSLGAGSFGKSIQQFGINVGTKKFRSNTRIFHQYALNNFTFENTALPETPTQAMPNALNKQWGILEDLSYQINSDHKLNASLWIQNVYREIPPPIGSQNAQTTQEDSVFRASLSWKGKVLKGHGQLRVGYSDESILYIDPLSLIYAPTHSKYVFGEGEYRRLLFEKVVFNAGFMLSNSTATSEGYVEEHQEMRGAYFFGIKLNILKKIEVSLTVRQDFTKDVQPPIVPAAGVDYVILRDRINLKGNVSRNFTLPTLNMKYWQPGGNPNIQPENGWGAELGIEGQIKQDKYSVSGELTAYENNVNDWVQWRPVSQGFWAPVNLKKVRARGIEALLISNLNVGKASLNIKANYQHTLSTNTEINESVLENTIGKQLIYVPKHNANVSLGVECNAWYFGYHQQIVGKRFTSTDNVHFLEAYTLGDIILQRTHKIAELDLRFKLAIENILNQKYFAIQGRPMPGRSFYFSISFTHNSIKK